MANFQARPDFIGPVSVGQFVQVQDNGHGGVALGGTTVPTPDLSAYYTGTEVEARLTDTAAEADGRLALALANPYTNAYERLLLDGLFDAVWTFDERRGKYRDWVGRKHLTPTFRPNFQDGWADGKLGLAARIESGKQVFHPYDPLFALGDFDFYGCFWCYIDSAVGNQYILGGNLVVNRQDFGDPGTYNRLQLSIPGLPLLTTPFNITAAAWHFIEYGHDAVNDLMWLAADGVDASQATGGAAPTDNGHGPVLGDFQAGAIAAPMTGRIDALGWARRLPTTTQRTLLQRGVQGPYNANPAPFHYWDDLQNLEGWYAKLRAWRPGDRLTIVHVGDSLSTGFSDPVLWQTAFIPRLQAAFAARLADGGKGIFPISLADDAGALGTYKPTWDVQGSAVSPAAPNDDYGPFGRLTQLNSGFIRVLEVYGDEVQIGILKTAFTGTFQVQIDGGAPVTVGGSAVTPTMAVETVSMGTLGYHTVKLTHVNDFILWGVIQRHTAGGVTLHNVSDPGKTIVDAAGSAHRLAYLPLLAPDMLGVMLAVNDFAGQVPLLTYAAGLRAQLQAGVDAGCRLFYLVKPHYRALSLTIKQSEYNLVIDQIAAEFNTGGNSCAVLSLWDLYGWHETGAVNPGESNNWEPGLGDVHNTAIGSAVTANAFLEGLLPSHF